MIHIILTEDKRKMNFTHDEFNRVRQFLMRMMDSSMDSFWLCSIVDEADKLKELKPGSSLYFVPSKCQCYTFLDIESLEKYCNRFEAGEILKGLDNETRDKYKPDWHNAYCVKRTEKLLVVRNVNYCYRYDR